ncbi:MAG: bactofilin family protein, partial [Rectinemataceae bacterium]
AVIASDVEFEGTITMKKPLMIKGRIKGSLSSESELYIDEGARIEADIQALVVSVKGGVQGNIVARERIDLFSTSVVAGDIAAPKVTMETGCRLNGTCRMAPSDDDGSQVV